MLESFLLKEVELNGVVFADFCENSGTIPQIFIFRSTLEFHLLTGCQSTAKEPPVCASNDTGSKPDAAI